MATAAQPRAPFHCTTLRCVADPPSWNPPCDRLTPRRAWGVVPSSRPTGCRRERFAAGWPKVHRRDPFKRSSSFVDRFAVLLTTFDGKDAAQRHNARGQAPPFRTTRDNKTGLGWPRTALKIRFLKGSVGSNPTFGTTFPAAKQHFLLCEVGVSCSSYCRSCRHFAAATEYHRRTRQSTGRHATDSAPLRRSRRPPRARACSLLERTASDGRRRVRCWPP